MKEKFDVTGMTCSACSSHVEKAVSRLEGVDKAEVNLLTNSMWVSFREDCLHEADIVKAVEAAGYGAKVTAPTSPGSPGGSPPSSGPGIVDEQLTAMKSRLWVSFLFLVPLMYVSMGHMAGLPLPGFLHGMENAVAYGLTQFLLCLPVVYVNRKYFEVGFRTLLRGTPNMDSLIAIGSTAALVYGIFAIYRMGYGLGISDMALVEKYHMDLYFESAATILALITLGKYLETKSKGKTSEALSRLIDLAPKTALVQRSQPDGSVETLEIPVEQVLQGDIIIIKPGTSIPVDGVIVEGSSSLDESAITGESIPVEKKAGDPVVAATINKSGFFKFRATKVGDDTTLAQIIRLMEEASASKAPIAKLADKIAGIFVPAVMIIAAAASVIWLLLGAEFEFALSIGIAVLVISCPCALGLATPVAIMVGTGKGAEHGILIKSGEALETAHSIDTIVLDKTGTITEGKPVVTDILPIANERFDGSEQAKLQLLSMAASLEAQSEHPLAEAIVNAGRRQAVELIPAQNFQAIFGRGASALIGGSLCHGGNEALMAESGIDSSLCKPEADRLAQEGKTPLLFARDGNICGIIAVADVVKPTSQEAIADFEAMGIQVIMLTGDNRRTAAAIQQQLGISQVIAEVLPQDKEREVAKLQQAGRRVAMVGDGINDAPALARADVGIAIGAGTDVAIESADVVLMKSQLTDAVTAIRLSKAVIRNIKQNLFWAFFYNSVGIPLAAGVLYSSLDWKLSPMFAAAAMSLSSVCVVTNALRLKLFQSKSVEKYKDTKPGKKEYNEEAEASIGGNNMKMKIEGMSCGHCSARVEKALNAISGVTATVNLEEAAAHIQLDSPVEAELLKKAVEDAGYEVTEIEQ